MIRNIKTHLYFFEKSAGKTLLETYAIKKTGF